MTDSISVEFITGEASLRALENLLRKSGYVSNQALHVALVDVLRQWAFDQERRSYYERYDSSTHLSARDDSSVPSYADHVQTAELKALQLGFQQRIPEEMLGARVEVAQELFARSIVAYYRAFVWAESESAQRCEVKYPADWWQAWKARFRHRLPQWFLKRYPIEYTTTIIDVRAIYPTFKQALPGLSCRLVVSKL